MCLAFVEFSRGLAIWCSCLEQFCIHVKIQTVVLSRAVSSRLGGEKQLCILEMESLRNGSMYL